MESTPRTKTCGSPWCNRLTSKASGGETRKIGGVGVCRACYQYVWEQSRRVGKPMAEILHTLPPPRRSLPAIETACARANCKVVFREGERGLKRRRIGLRHVCQRCYQAAWEFSKAKGISLGEAFLKLPPQGVEERSVAKVPSCWLLHAVVQRKDQELVPSPNLRWTLRLRKMPNPVSPHPASLFPHFPILARLGDRNHSWECATCWFS